MARPCHPFHAELQPDGACHWCDLYRTDPAYRALWDGTPGPPAPVLCRHLGGPTGRVVGCPTCRGGTVKLKVMGCGVHGECTAGKAVAGLACCSGCDRYEPAG